MGFGIKGDDLILVLDVAIDASGRRVGLGELRLAPDGNGGHRLAGGGLEYRGRLAASVKSIHLAPAGLIENRVGILAGVDLGERLQGLEINDARLVFPAVAGEAAPQLGGEGEAMDARRVRDFSGDLVLDGVDRKSVV